MEIVSLIFPIRAGCIWLARKKRKVGAGFYNGWGGKLERVDRGSVIKAAIREFKDDSGATAYPRDLDHVATIRFYEAGKLVFECNVYFLRSWEGEIQETDQMGPPEVFSFSEIPYEEMMPGDCLWLPLLLRGERIKGQCWYSEGNKEVQQFDFGPLHKYNYTKRPLV